MQCISACICYQYPQPMYSTSRNKFAVSGAGDKFWNQFYLAPVRDENNCVSHYIGIQSDVTNLMHQAEMPESAGTCPK